jgi:two-component system chemotaxis sensor kinase CheA
MVMDDETLGMYVEEAMEHLADIENDLLAIEQAGADIDEELVNKVFRAAHSIKGGAGFLGLTKIKDLGHKIENVLDLIRNRELTPTPDVVNIVLLAFDKLRDMIAQAATSNDVDIDEHIAALTGIVTGGGQPTAQAAVETLVDIQDARGRGVFAVPRFDLEQAQKGGKTLYLLEFDLIHDIESKKKTVLDILKNLETTGTVIDIKLDLDAVGVLEDGEFTNRIPLFVLFASIIEQDIMPALLDLGPQGIRVVDIATAPTLAPDFAKELLEATPATPAEDRTDDLVKELFSADTLAAAVGGGETASATQQPKTPQPPKIPQEPKAPQTAVSPTSVAPAVSSPAADAADAAGDVATPKSGKTFTQSETLRVHVSLLEDLMNLAGELVLSRNQLMQAISVGALHQIQVAGQRIDLVTSELQETIMLTRMQTIGTIFNKFPRVVRDLARSLGKQIDLQLEGNEVELDKTIIEGLGDPLTHLVRNAADHGIEPPEERIARGKNPTGTILLKAYHEAGQVIVEIVDDGRGLNTAKIVEKALAKGLITADQAKGMSEKEKANLIFLPGLSTAEKVTDVSGRGVGMDVVKSNLDQLGGQVDIETAAGKGTTIRIKLPLTLAIIPSLLVSVGEERFAVPQVNVDELLRISAQNIGERIELVGDAEVLLLRGELIPLVYLSGVLGLGEEYMSAARMVGHVLRGEPAPEKSVDINLVVVSAGQFRYGLVVDELHDSVEIVVKPLGRHFKECQGYAGATIMGDGHVALILDVAGLGRLADLSLTAGLEQKAAAAAKAEVSQAAREDRISLFTFRNTSTEHCAVPLDLVARVELIHAKDIEEVSGRRVIKYRGGTLPVFSLDQAASVGVLELAGELVVIVFSINGHEIGLLASPPVDAIEVQVAIDTFTLRQPGISGSAIIADNTTLIVDIYELVQTLQPDWFVDRASLVASSGAEGKDEGGVPNLLLVEDSEFFRNQVRRFLEADGYTVETAEDGLVAWKMLQTDPHRYDLVVTDIEMPNMDGFQLTERIRADARFTGMPVVALTSLASEEDQARGKAVGIDAYEIKLDKDRLLQSIYDCLQRYAAA